MRIITLVTCHLLVATHAGAQGAPLERAVAAAERVLASLETPSSEEAELAQLASVWEGAVRPLLQLDPDTLQPAAALLPELEPRTGAVVAAALLRGGVEVGATQAWAVEHTRGAALALLAPDLAASNSAGRVAVARIAQEEERPDLVRAAAVHALLKHASEFPVQGALSMAVRDEALPPVTRTLALRCLTPWLKSADLRMLTVALADPHPAFRGEAVRVTQLFLRQNPDRVGDLAQAASAGDPALLAAVAPVLSPYDWDGERDWMLEQLQRDLEAEHAREVLRLAVRLPLEGELAAAGIELASEYPELLPLAVRLVPVRRGDPEADDVNAALIALETAWAEHADDERAVRTVRSGLTRLLGADAPRSLQEFADLGW